MSLHDASGPVPDPWVRVENGQTAPPGARAILSLDRLLQEGAPEDLAALGVHVGAEADPDGLAWLLGRAALICVGFSAFSDGRGFSVARRLRAMGFSGELRAFGPLIADQFAALLAVGFDTVETPAQIDARQPPEQWAAAARAVSLAYQRGYGGPRRRIPDARAERGAS